MIPRNVPRWSMQGSHWFILAALSRSAFLTRWVRVRGRRWGSLLLLWKGGGRWWSLLLWPLHITLCIRVGVT